VVWRWETNDRRRGCGFGDWRRGARQTLVCGVELCSLRLPACGKDEGEAGGVEHAGLGIDSLAKVLGADKRMVAASFGDDAVNVKAVSRDQTTDIFGSEEEDPLEAILLLGLEGKTALALEERTGGPGGTPEDTGGVGGGGHGVEVLIELGGVDFLGFVDR